CYLSLADANRSANRGECVQICRRSYTVTDTETGNQLEVDNKYIMSPKDLKTVRFIDKMMEAGVRVFKIEGRARGPEYVYTVVRCYKEAIEAVLNGSFNEAEKDEWDARLATVFNRGFWDGYYQGQKLGEWNKHYGSVATEKKVLVGKIVKYFSKLNVAEVAVEATHFNKGEKLLITGPTTGVMYLTADEIRFDLQPVEKAEQGTRVSIPVVGKVRPNDKIFKLEQSPSPNPSPTREGSDMYYNYILLGLYLQGILLPSLFGEGLGVRLLLTSSVLACCSLRPAMPRHYRQTQPPKGLPCQECRAPSQVLSRQWQR
uniref:peptidase U32 family protein n=1 Tax=Segatella oris TaxID=28135 RepID=UPI0028D5134F